MGLTGGLHKKFIDRHISGPHRNVAHKSTDNYYFKFLGRPTLRRPIKYNKMFAPPHASS